MDYLRHSGAWQWFSLVLKVFGVQIRSRSPCMHSSGLIPEFHKQHYKLIVLRAYLFLISTVISSSLGFFFSDLWINTWGLPHCIVNFHSCACVQWWEVREKKYQQCWPLLFHSRPHLIRELGHE